jgi:uncharacterized protein YdaL
MRSLREPILLGGLLLLCAAPPGSSLPAGGRPVPQKGENALTLVVYAARRSAFSLGNELEAFNLQLRQVETRLECIPVEAATPERLHAADYVAVFCPQDSPQLPAEFLRAVAEAPQPVLWVGHGAEQLTELPAFRGQFEISGEGTGLPAEKVNYRGRSWAVRVDPWIPAQLPSNSTAQVLLTVPATSEGTAGERPLCWKSGRVTFVATVPTVGPMSFLFTDLLWDFYSVATVPKPRVFLRIEDYSCRGDHRAFRRMVDYLSSRGHPFMVGVIPALRNPATGQVSRLESEPEFVAALRYAQQRGGRLVMHGSSHAHGNEPGEGHEFWDVDLDRPLPGETAESVRTRLLDGVRQMVQQGLFPLAWETPHYAASRLAYTEIARVFSTAVERVQLGDASCLEDFTGAAPTLDQYGRVLLPENAGYILNQPAAPGQGIQDMGEILVGLRGTVAGCYIHPYQPLERLTELVGLLERWNVPFLDLAKLDNVVQVPNALLLTGRARRTVTLRNVVVRRKIFDRAGRLLSQQEEKAPSSGDRTFTCSSPDGYDRVEFVEAKP